MKKSRIAQLLILAAGLVASALVSGHHGWSEYDSTREIKLTGTIKASGYEHPHGHIRLETAGTTWTAVLAPPSRMEAPTRRMTGRRRWSTLPLST